MDESITMRFGPVMSKRLRERAHKWNCTPEQVIYQYVRDNLLPTDMEVPERVLEGDDANG